MKKAEMIAFITKHYDLIEAMGLDLGHHSWHYTNRSPDTCINVKIHAWADAELLKEKLSAKDKKAVELLSIDLNEFIHTLTWEYYGVIDNERMAMEEALKANYPDIIGFEYGGKSGGWLCIQYDTSSIYEDFDSGEYDYKQTLAMYKEAKRLLTVFQEVENYVIKAKKALEAYIESSDFLNYCLGELTELLDNRKEEQAELYNNLQA